MRLKDKHVMGDTTVESGAPDYKNSLLVDQLCEAVLSRLAEGSEGHRLLIRLSRVRVPPGSPPRSAGHLIPQNAR